MFTRMSALQIFQNRVYETYTTRRDFNCPNRPRLKSNFQASLIMGYPKSVNVSETRIIKTSEMTSAEMRTPPLSKHTPIQCWSNCVDQSVNCVSGSPTVISVFRSSGGGAYFCYFYNS